MGDCGAMKTAFVDDMQAIAAIYLCSSTAIRSHDKYNDPSTTKLKTEISISSTRNGFIDTTVERSDFSDGSDPALVTKEFYLGRTYAFISVHDQQFRIVPKMDLDVIHRLMALAKSNMETSCKSSMTSTSIKTFTSEDAVEGSQEYHCQSNNWSRNGSKSMTDLLTEKITLVDAPLFNIVEGAGSNAEISEPSRPSGYSRTGDDLPFLSRRRSIVSQGGLCVALSIVVFLRLLIRCFVVNDVDNEIEDVLKLFFGNPWCESLLQSNSKLQYYQKSYFKKEFQYGVQGHRDGSSVSSNY